MFELIKSNLDKILLVTGAVVILFWPKIKEALAASKTSTPSTGVDGQCPLCFPLSVNPTDKGRPEWTVVVMDLEGFCKSQRLSKAVKLCHELCNELVAGEPDKPTAASAANAAVKGARK
jgi:hypothetical protein